MKCPACGMETPDTQNWCDFCKEPFRKKPAAAKAAEHPPLKPAQESPKPAGESQKPASEKKNVVVTPELLAKLQAPQTRSKSVDPNRGAIPPEFARLDTGERIPIVSPFMRKLAWVFLSIVFIWIIVFTAILLSRGGPSADGGAKVHIVQ